MIKGVLTLKTSMVVDVMTPINRVYALRSDAQLDAATLAEMVDLGYSRVPIHPSDADGSSIQKYLMVKELLPLAATQKAFRVDATGDGLNVPLYDPVWIGPKQDLFELLNRFQ